MINSKTKLMGLLGYPVSHSFSPTLHNSVMEIVDFNGAYLAYCVEPETLDEAIIGLKALDFFGCNVTVPHKTTCMASLDHISETARNIGAVNTISHKDGLLYGDNTDAYGFSKTLQDTTNTNSIKTAAILGAGGSAKSVLVSLISMGIENIMVFARNIEKCSAFVEHYKKAFPKANIEPVLLSNFSDYENQLDLLVNCTPVGMHPKVNNSPIVLRQPKEDMIIIDLIYNPKTTALMQQGIDIGLTVKNGLDMLIYQAAKSFEIWTGISCEEKYVEVAKEFL